MFCNVTVVLIVISIMYKFNVHSDVDFSKYAGVTGGGGGFFKKKKKAPCGGNLL